MVLLLCLWDNLKFWRIFALGTRESGDVETSSIGSYRATSYYCNDNGDAILPSSVPYTLPSNTATLTKTSKVSCSYYSACNQTKPNNSKLKHLHKNKRPPDDLSCDDEDDDDGSSYKITTEVSMKSCAYYGKYN